MSSIHLLLKLIDEAYEKRTWHGPNLRGALRGLSAKEAAWRPGPKRHNIREIVVHAAYWKYTVRRRILGEKRGSFPLKGSNWFRRPEIASDKEWKNDVKMLETMHREMRRAIMGLRQSDLRKRPGGSKYTNEAMIYGVAFHDVYHAGQIQLLKRLHKK
jgi:uncharacterized damage-inducible protein DinB